MKRKHKRLTILLLGLAALGGAAGAVKRMSRLCIPASDSIFSVAASAQVM